MSANRSVARSSVASKKRPAGSAPKLARLVPVSPVARTRPPRPELSALELARVSAVEDATIMVEGPRLGPDPRPARALMSPGELAPGDEVLVARVGEAGAELVILGRLFDPRAPARDVRVNGRKVSIEADTELVLRCASATIRIGRDGLIAVRGDRVTTQARGANRIRGGSVDIN